MDELRTGLELATTEELYGLTHLLFHRRFNPLDYLMGIDSTQLPFKDRQSWLDHLDHRFRFLAADGFTVLQQKTQDISYRNVLARVCRYFNLNATSTCSTIALEEEIFLHLLDVAYQKLSPQDQKNLEHYFQKTIARTIPGQAFYTPCFRHSLHLILKGSSAVVLDSIIRPIILRHLASQIMVQMVQYQITKQALVSSGRIALGGFKHHAMQVARQGVATNLARYGAVRSVFAFLGPAMWAWFFADLGWRAIATNYGRIIPVIFTLAQIRLLRTESDSHTHPTGLSYAAHC